MRDQLMRALDYPGPTQRRDLKTLAAISNSSSSAIAAAGLSSHLQRWIERRSASASGVQISLIRSGSNPPLVFPRRDELEEG